MLLIEHKIWHGISPEGYRQVFTKMNQNYICQQGNTLLDTLRVLDLVRMSRSRVKGHRRGGVCVLRMLLVFFFFFFCVRCAKNSSRLHLEVAGDATKISYCNRVIIPKYEPSSLPWSSQTTDNPPTCNPYWFRYVHLFFWVLLVTYFIWARRCSYH